MALSDLQTLQNMEIADGSYSHDKFGHYRAVCDDLKTRLMGATKQFDQDVLTVRSEFAWDLSAQIRNSQLLLSTAAASSRPRHYDHEAQGYYSVFEEHMSSVTEKSAKYAQIAAEEVPKSLYCLGVHLTTEWFQNSELQEKLAERNYAVASKITDNSLYHFFVFSDNIVATSVVVNSTALNSKAPEKVVFHLVTNEINYAAMKSWFTINMDNLRGVTVDVQKFEDFKWLNASYVPVLKQLQD
uniref:Hexosyltransferase n=1 Tax=Brassica oleracea var. oleracea TaxID=109376 RepID=A0A0D3E5I9_BRAOL